MGVEEIVVRLRTSGRMNPFVRSFLFVFALLAFSAIYGIVIFSLFGVLPGSEGGRSASGLFPIAGMVTQFLAALTAVWLFRRFLDRQSFASLGIDLESRWPGLLVWGVALGAGLMVLSAAVFAAFGWVEVAGSGWTRARGLQSILAWGLGGFIGLALGSFYEELIARGYLLQNLSAGSNTTAGVLLSSVIFGVAHLANPNSSLLAAANTALAGLLFALIYLHTGSLWASIGVHFGWNFTQNYIVGLPVSGLDVFGGRTPLQSVETGPDIATGGAFGPEGGLIVTVVLAATSLYFLLRLRAKRSGTS